MWKGWERCYLVCRKGPQEEKKGRRKEYPSHPHSIYLSSPSLSTFLLLFCYVNGRVENVSGLIEDSERIRKQYSIFLPLYHVLIRLSHPSSVIYFFTPWMLCSCYHVWGGGWGRQRSVISFCSVVPFVSFSNSDFFSSWLPCFYFLFGWRVGKAKK